MDSITSTDIGIVVIVLFFGLLGYARGGLSQLFGLGALVLAYVLSGPVGEVIVRFLSERYQWAPSATAVVGKLAAGMGVYIAAKLLFFVVGILMGVGGAHGKPWNRKLGALLGMTKAAAVLWLLFCLFSPGSRLNFQLPWGLNERVAESRIAAWAVQTYNPVAQTRVVTVMSKMRVVSQDPQSMQRLSQDPEVGAFLSELRKVVTQRMPEGEVPEDIRSGDPVALVKAARLKDFLQNEDLVEALLDIDVEAATEKAVESLPKDSAD